MNNKRLKAKKRSKRRQYKKLLKRLEKQIAGLLFVKEFQLKQLICGKKSDHKIYPGNFVFRQRTVGTGLELGKVMHNYYPDVIETKLLVRFSYFYTKHSIDEFVDPSKLFLLK